MPVFGCNLCVLRVLRGSLFVQKNTRGADHAEVTQRRRRGNDFWSKAGKQLLAQVMAGVSVWVLA